MEEMDGFELGRVKTIQDFRQFYKNIIIKIKGSHITIKMPTGQLITIPVTKELKIGLLKDALRKAGLTETQFSELS
ncbi:MAG: type II toxin-antitoxin system HicA family toxin [Candidatus Omnitrophota bacterium]